MKKITLLLIFTTILITGCSNTSSQNQTAQLKPEKKQELIAKIDKEAATLGFPERFISKEKEDINWSEATSKKVGNMDVAVYDTGVTLEVCGGFNCDM